MEFAALRCCRSTYKKTFGIPILRKNLNLRRDVINIHVLRQEIFKKPVLWLIDFFKDKTLDIILQIVIIFQKARMY